MQQKKLTQVRQFLGYGGYSEIKLKALVDELDEMAWRSLRNFSTPVIDLIEKTREGSKVKKK